MGIFKKSVRKETEEVLMDRLVVMDPAEVGYSETVDALNAVSSTKTDKKGIWTFLGTIGGAVIAGLFGLVLQHDKFDGLKYFHNREKADNTIFTTNAEKAAERNYYH